MRSLASLVVMCVLPATVHAASLDHYLISVYEQEPATAQGIALRTGSTIYLAAREVDTDGTVGNYDEQYELSWSLAGPGAISNDGGPYSNYETYTPAQPGEVDISVVDVQDPAVVGRLHISVYQPQLSSFFIYPSDYLFALSPDFSVTYLIAGRAHPFAASNGVDQYGQQFPIPAITWSLSQPQLGSIDSSGTVVAQPGVADVIASAGGATTRRSCDFYLPQVARIAAYNAEQDSPRFATRSTDPILVTATAYDQFNQQVLPAPAFSWATTPGSDGTVDQDGWFTPYPQDGTAGVIASVDGIASPTAVITVAVPNAGPIGLDPYTVGDWFHAYGRDGWFKAGDDRLGLDSSSKPSYYITQLPSFRGVESVTSLVYLGTENTNGRALATSETAYQSPATRVIAWWSSPAAFTFPIDFSDDTYHEVSFYLLDWQELNASERIDIINPTTGQQLSSSGTVSSFQNGVYVRFWIKGRVAIRVTPLTANVPAVLAGIFYGGAFDPTTPG
jgi:hypothetical protein